MPGTVEDLTYIHSLNLPTNFMSRVIFSSSFYTCGIFQVERLREVNSISKAILHFMLELLFGPPGTLPLKTTHLTIIILLVATVILLDICLKFWFPMRQMLLKISSVQFSRSVMSDSSQLHEPQLTRPPCASPTPGVHPNPCPLSQWCHPTISSSVFFLPSPSPSSPARNLSQHQGLFKWVSSLHHVAKVLKFQLQHQSFQWTPRTDLP